MYFPVEKRFFRFLNDMSTFKKICENEANRQAVANHLLPNQFIISVSAPLSGELPKAEGAAQAVYFTMNITSKPDAVHRSGKPAMI